MLQRVDARMPPIPSLGPAGALQWRQSIHAPHGSPMHLCTASRRRQRPAHVLLATVVPPLRAPPSHHRAYAATSDTAQSTAPRKMSYSNGSAGKRLTHRHLLELEKVSHCQSACGFCFIWVPTCSNPHILTHSMQIQSTLEVARWYCIRL